MTEERILVIGLEDPQGEILTGTWILRSDIEAVVREMMAEPDCEECTTTAYADGIRAGKWLVRDGTTPEDPLRDPTGDYYDAHVDEGGKVYYTEKDPFRKAVREWLEVDRNCWRARTASGTVNLAGVTYPIGPEEDAKDVLIPGYLCDCPNCMARAKVRDLLEKEAK